MVKKKNLRCVINEYIYSRNNRITSQEVREQVSEEISILRNKFINNIYIKIAIILKKRTIVLNFE